MPSPFSLGAQNADLAFGGFTDDQIAAGGIASGTGAGTATGLGFTPDWVVFSISGAATNSAYWTATSTTLTITGRSTTTAGVISYIAGNLS